jgi:outer membrane lipoprotein-sorting protein
VNILRRVSLSRLLLLCGLVVGLGVSATAIAFAFDSATPPPNKPLASALHDALAGAGGESVQGVSAQIQLTDHLVEGASLASGGGEAGQLASSPLLTGASGRLWIAKDGRMRLELQAKGGGDTQVLYDGHTVSLYDASTNTLYRYAIPAHEGSPSASGPSSSDHHEAPSVAKIEEAISHLSRHADVSTTPTDIAGQPAYTVRISPKEGGSLLGGAELSFDAVHGTPLRAALYSSTSASPVLELAATEVSYGPVEDSVFAFTPPAGVKTHELKLSHGEGATGRQGTASGAGKPKLTTSGHGPSTVAILESQTKPGAGNGGGESLEGLPKVTINGVSASELRTELGTVLSFERLGVRYVLAGSVTPATIEALARGL